VKEGRIVKGYGVISRCNKCD